MSDSDETICNEGSNGESESEEQNSPSILSSWYPIDGKRKEISGSENTIGLKDNSRTNLIKSNVDEFSDGSESPEFPLLSRRLKRKGTEKKINNRDDMNESSSSVNNEEKDLNEPSHCDDNSKVFRGEAGFLINDSVDEKTRNTKNVPTHLTQTLGESEVDDTTKIEALLVNLETEMTELEIEQSSGDNVNDARLKDVKSQLAVLQNALVEANHENRVTRKKIISSDGCEQLTEEKRKAILSLARKQRNVLEVFKKYKNLAQRLRQLKSQKESKCTENTEDLSVKSIERTQNPAVSPAALIRSENEVSTTKLSVHQPSPSVTFVEESAPVKINNIEQTPGNRPDKNIKTVNAIKPMQHPRPSVNPVPANIYKVIIVPSSSEVPVAQNFTSVSANGSNGVPIDHRLKTHMTVQPNQVITKQPAKKQIVTRPNAVPTSLAQSIKTYHTPSSSSAKSHNGLNTMATATTNTTNSLGCTHPDGPPPTIQDQTQRRQRVQIESSYTAVQQPHKTTTIVGKCQSSINQLLTKPISGASLSLETLVKDGVLTSGKNVLTATAEGKLYSASLSDKGMIVSAGGEGFTSPRSWVKAILGSKRKVKHDVAWKMVSYKGKSLLNFANKTITETTKQKTVTSSSSISKLNVQDSVATDNDRRKQITNLINSRAALNALLRNCRVTPVEKEELVPSEEILMKDFWEKTEFELESLNKDILFGLEFQ